MDFNSWRSCCHRTCKKLDVMINDAQCGSFDCLMIFLLLKYRKNNKMK